MTEKELVQLAYDFYDTIQLDVPDNGVDLWDYMKEQEEKFSDIDLPDEFEGELFNLVTDYELVKYLQSRYNITVVDRSPYWIEY